MTIFAIARFARDETLDVREVLENVRDGEADFVVDGCRFIADSSIDEIMCEEMAADAYMLGFFNAWFLADVTGISEDVIEAMQRAEAYDAIGKLVIELGKLEDLQSAYASADGYGHHFNSYDHSEHEVHGYYAFPRAA